MRSDPRLDRYDGMSHVLTYGGFACYTSVYKYSTVYTSTAVGACATCLLVPCAVIDCDVQGIAKFRAP